MKIFRQLIAIITVLLITVNLGEAKLKVASLHPLMTDLAKQVGGDSVDVVELIDHRANPHHFEPTPKILLRAKGAQLYLASGKGLETYLAKLESTLGNSSQIIEVGKTIPSLKINANDSQFVCCPNHSHGAIDPHWWHKVSNMQKAARVVAKHFGKADPNNAALYQGNAERYSQRLDTLHSSIKREVSKIPSRDRILATAHAAFGYFCKEYGFKALPVKGLSAHQETSAAYQAQAIQEIHKKSVKAIFPEKRANPKSLKVISQETGVTLGAPLIADGSTSYEAMMRANVANIVKALTQ